jgi:uncharacterized membrane protein YsdA (DUF1294 family)
MGLALSLSSAILLLFAFGSWSWPLFAVAWFLAVSLTTFGYYGFDKARARNGGRRVPEVVLHGLACAGGSLGAYAGMQFFRHKTLKGTFRIVFWTIVVLQLGLIAALVKRVWFSS